MTDPGVRFMAFNDRVPRALRGEPVDRTPIWFMRQAGRILPEYRAIREKVSFIELMNDPDLACEVTCQPVDRFGLDAAIVFSDILTIPVAMGMDLEFAKGHGPVMGPVVRTASDVARLAQPDVADTLTVLPQTLERFRKARPDTPILGFTGAPWTLLCYMVHGSGSKNWEHAKALLHSDPDTARALLDRLADLVGDYLQLQLDHGAAAVQMFDTWAGTLSPRDWRDWAAPAAARAFSRVKGGVRLYYTKDTAPFLPWLSQVGADAYSVDWRVELDRVRETLGPDVPVQGNLDPVTLFGTEASIRERVRDVLDRAGPVGHVFNLGHGVLPSTPLEGVYAMVDEVKRYGVHGG